LTSWSFADTDSTPLASISNVSGHIPLTFGGTPCPFNPVQHSPAAQFAGRCHA